MITVQIPTALKPYADNQGTLTARGATAGEVMAALMARHPKLQPHLFNSEGKLRNFVNVYINDEDIRYLKGMDTPVQDGDTVIIVPAVAGGSLWSKAPSSALSKEEIQRYSRHLILPEVGVEGQQKLKNASVLIIGAGGLGAPVALYLAAAGIGRLGLVDFDVVDVTNLQRQVIYDTGDVGKPKLRSAADRIKALNRHIKIDAHETRIRSANALDLIRPYDIVIDGTDNFPARYLVNDACVLLGKPNVYGSIFRFEGQASVFWAEKGPCYRCLYPEPPPPGLVPSCAEGGVLGVLPGVIGLIQATEAVKLILGGGETLVGRLLLYDAWAMKFREMRLQKDPACPICGAHPTIKALVDYEEFCGLRADPRETAMRGETISAVELNQEIHDGRKILVLDVREPHEAGIGRIPGSRLIPLGELEDRVNELNRDADIVAYCRSGGRSARAVRLLREQGFTRVRNLAGGILAWSDQVDPSIPKY
jgi:adenylyltransferase/sulfurtransferase